MRPVRSATRIFGSDPKDASLNLAPAAKSKVMNDETQEIMDDVRLSRQILEAERTLEADLRENKLYSLEEAFED